MGDGIRPKGQKSYAALRSPEAFEAHQKDMAERRRCPKCGGEVYFDLGNETELPCYRCSNCGHEEKVR